MLHLIIDGYNLIRQVPALARAEKGSLEAGRDTLIKLLSAYKREKKHDITIVFDGNSELGESTSFYRQAGIKVGFSSHGVSADDVIKKMCRELKAKAIVVSSDRSVMREAAHNGCATMNSIEFYGKLQLAARLAGGVVISVDEDKTRAHKRWTTFKKGPSRKATKKERRQSGRLKKL